MFSTRADYLQIKCIRKQTKKKEVLVVVRFVYAVPQRELRIDVKYDPHLILAIGTGAHLERGPNLCHLWAAQIQADHLGDVSSSPLAHHEVIPYSDSHCHCSCLDVAGP